MRYDDGSADAWASRVAELASSDSALIAGALHSVRALPTDPAAALAPLAGWAAGRPLHVHLSEQVAENDGCLAAYGVTPTRLLADHGLLGPLTSAVHATHLTDDDIALLGAARAFVSFCPTTERDLGDGVGPSRALRRRGRAPDPRLRQPRRHRPVRGDARRRARRAPRQPAARTLAGRGARAGSHHSGHASLGWDDAGAIAVGQRADLVTLDAASPRTAGTGADEHTVVFAAAAADVTMTMVDGRIVFRQGDRESVGTRPRRRRSGRCGPCEHPDHWHRRAGHQRPRTPDGPMTTVTPPGRSGSSTTLRSCSRAAPSPGSDPAGSAPAADTVYDAGGRAVIPGYVDSHSHLVFSGDRAQEFAARMTGEPYSAGGIRTTVAATRAATDEQLMSHVARLVAEMRAQGTTSLEIKSGYGLTVHDEARSLAVARHFTEDTTFLGAHVVPSDTTPEDYVDLVTGPMLTAAAPHARWIDVFCEDGAFDVDQARAILAAGTDNGLRGRLHANQLTYGGGVKLAVRARPGRGRPLHLPRRRRRQRARRLRHDRDAAAGRGVLDPAPLSRCADADRCRREGRDRQ